MPDSIIEHVNLTVSDPEKTARMLDRIFGWKIRWQGAAMDGGYTIHVGGTESYLALYRPRESRPRNTNEYNAIGALNHVGIVVDDLDAAEEKAIAEGFQTHNHGNYEPGRRFYFNDGDGTEFEVVSYN